MKTQITIASLFVLLVVFSIPTTAQNPAPRFRVIALAEKGGIHLPFVNAAKVWLQKLAADSNFTIDYIENADKIDSVFLSRYQLFIQLNYPPYMWSDTAKAAFTKSITEGTTGWIGFHHATLLGEFDGYQMWPWFSWFMGGIRYKNYIAGFAKATVHTEDSIHPCMQGVPATFEVQKDEWYTYNKSPRENVHVLASVDESSYTPETDLKMGDHPVVWINEQVKARNVYIFMGHDAGLFKNKAYTRLFNNSIFWAANKSVVKTEK